MKHAVIKSLLFTAVFLHAAAYASKNAINDSAALANMKVGKSIFLVDIGDTKNLNFYPQVIHGMMTKLNLSNC
jgi:hypothetical protein